MSPQSAADGVAAGMPTPETGATRVPVAPVRGRATRSSPLPPTGPTTGAAGNQNPAGSEQRRAAGKLPAGPALRGEAWRQAAKAATAKSRKTTRPRKAAPPSSLPLTPPGQGAGLTATAHCIGSCEWTAGPGSAREVDKAAENHSTKPPEHPTATVAEPKAAA